MTHLTQPEMANAAEDDEAASPAQETPKIDCSPGFPDWLKRNQVSLAFTSYQSGRLYLVGLENNGHVSFHERYLARAMGLYADPKRLLVSTIFQIWRFENIVEDGALRSGSDKHYVPRLAHTTGDIDIHDLSVLGDGRILFVNTRYSCIATLSPTHSFKPQWKPYFISKLAPEDRCHLNGMALRDGGVSHVTAVSKSDELSGWRDRRGDGGCVIDVAANEIITENLSMPHSPRWYKDQLWVLNSGTGYLGTIDTQNGTFDPKVFCPGFLRGLTFHNDHAIVGLSLPRNGTFTDLQLDEELTKRQTDPWAGVQIIELSTGSVAEWIRFGSVVTELFDVQVLPGVVRPTATGFLTNEIHSLVSIDLS